MKAIAENIYTRGQHGIQYVRRRIPAAIRAAYPAKQTHIVRSLGTADRRLAKERAHAELARIDAEFKLKSEQLDLSRVSISAKRIAKLDDDQLKDIARFWVRQVLLADDQRRQAGLDDAEFDELDAELAEQRAQLGRMLAQGKSMSMGQSGEASYWLPVLMFYTGARPEELAGLALSDLQHDEKLGWYLNLIDRPSDEDADLFDDGVVPQSHRRTLKNAPSVRRVPVAQELIDLGLLRYAELVRQSGAAVLFPTLTKDSHGKLSGSFSKFFGRYKRAVGITDSRKVLYSFRHTMKDMLEAAAVPSKYLKRLMGHTTGDGAITDGYGSDLPFELLVEQFRKVRFPALAAKPWQPGQGYVSLKANA